MPQLVVTPGDPNANGYLTESEFKDYWSIWSGGSVRQPAWIAGATDPQIQGAIIAATMLIDVNFIWTGVANMPPVIPVPQALAWPRSGMFDVNGVPIPNDPQATGAIPLRLKNATAEFAGQLYQQDRLADDDADKFQVELVRAGDVELRTQRASLETIESADIWARLKGPEFNWMSREVPEAVRRMLLQSWYTQPTIKRPLVFRSFGGSTGNRSTTDPNGTLN